MFKPQQEATAQSGLNALAYGTGVSEKQNKQKPSVLRVSSVNIIFTKNVTDPAKNVN